VDTAWALSEQNVEIVRSGLAAFEKGDIEAVLRVCAEDIVITQPPELPGVAAEQHGHQGVLEALAAWPEQWDDYQIETLRICAAPGDKVFVTQRTRGRGKQSGVDVEMDFSFVFAVSGGEIREWRLFIQEDHALKAAGLSG
jgi:ketosteroid isomerase-like protein